MPDLAPVARESGRQARARRRVTLLLLSAFFLTVGCTYHGREATDEAVKDLASRPYDPLPDQLLQKPGASASSEQKPSSQEKSSSVGAGTSAATVPAHAMDVQTVAYMETAQTSKDAGQPGKLPSFQLTVPEAIPGSEVPSLNTVPFEQVARSAALNKLYPPLPPLEPDVKPLPGPDGKPYTLSDLQRIAAENSPVLRQASSDVQAALGALKQAETYKNPTVSLQEQASNNNSTGGAFGFAFDQVVSTGGKMKLQSAAAYKNLANAELALKRARNDLATQVRNAYYALLVAKETMRVTRALSALTEEVYRVQLAYTVNFGQAAVYEPAALRAQAWTARLAYKQASATYVYTWKTLVAAIGERQLPLSEVAGRIDAIVPNYEYDRILAHVLRNHTDALTALNGIDYQKYNLKVSQISPYFPDLDFNIGMYKDRALFPFGQYATFAVSAPLPIWDQNRGNILQAEAALIRALEEPHRVELALTNTLATNYTNYKTNLDAVEYYRRYVLPDQVRAYQGVLARRQIDQAAQFGDLIAAQQALATSVTTYLGLLGSLWTSVVSVADLLQTDDLFQTAQPKDLPALPDLENLPPLPCCHPLAKSGAAGCAARTSGAFPTINSDVPAMPIMPPTTPTVSIPGTGKAASTPSIPMPMPPVVKVPEASQQPSSTNIPAPMAPPRAAPNTTVPAPLPTTPSALPGSLNIPAPRPLPPEGGGETGSSISRPRTQFRISDEVLAELRKQQLPDAVLARLLTMRNKEYTPGDFMSAIGAALTAEEAGHYQQLIMSLAYIRTPAESSSGIPISLKSQRPLSPVMYIVQRQNSEVFQASFSGESHLPPDIVPSVLPGG